MVFRCRRLPTFNRGCKKDIERTAYKVHGRFGRAPWLRFYILSVREGPSWMAWDNSTALAHVIVRDRYLSLLEWSYATSLDTPAQSTPSVTRIFRTDSPPFVSTTRELPYTLTVCAISSALALDLRSKTSLHAIPSLHYPSVSHKLSQSPSLPFPPPNSQPTH